MTIEIPPTGTKGAGKPPSGRLARALMSVMRRVHRLTGSKMSGRPLLYLTTLGARSGQRRTSVVMPFPDGEDAWFIVASRRHRRPSGVVLQPGQAARPGGDRNRGPQDPGDPRRLTGEERAAAGARITRERPNFAGYEEKTDREIPVVRLTAR